MSLVIAGETRHIAAEDAAKYRDALGVVLPQGLPDSFLASSERPLASLVRRYARTHGPFGVADLARRFGLSTRLRVATRCASSPTRVPRSRASSGPVAPGVEWVDAGVLRTLRQRSLARLRREVEPVEQAALARFATAWHGLDAPRAGRGRAARRDRAAPGRRSFPRPTSSRASCRRASAATTRATSTRCSPRAPRSGSAAARADRTTGKISIFLTEHLALLPEPRDERPTGSTHQKIRELLAARGAVFFPQLLAGLGGGFTPEVLEALWDLVWSGEVTNDTLQPLRGFIRSPASRARRRANAARRSTYPTRASMLVSAERAAIYSKESAGRWSLIDSLRVPDLTRPNA